jgi:type IV pilus assembly protein PilM
LKSAGELSSTERLLEQIRNKAPKGSARTQKPLYQWFLKSLPLSLTALFAFRSKIVVGVDIGYNDLRLIKVKQFTGKEDNILAHQKIPSEENLAADSNQFTPLLRSALKEIGAAPKRTNVWTVMPLKNVDRHYMEIPKVSEKQMADAVYWKYKKEAAFNDQEAVFDFEPLGDVDEDGKPKTAVMVYAAPRKEIEEITQLFSKSGFPLKGLTTAPVAFQNYFRADLSLFPEKKIGILDIDMNQSRIDIFSNGNLVLSRDIKTSINSLIEAVSQELANERRTVDALDFLDDDIPQMDEEPIAVEPEDREKAHRILFKNILDSPSIDGGEEEDLIGRDRILSIISPVLDRLVWQVEVTSRHYASNFKTDAMEKILIAGEISNSDAIVRYIGNQLKLPSEKIDPFRLGIPSARNVPEPDSQFDRNSFARAMGIAISNGDRTPNFILTRKDRHRRNITRRINRMTYSAFILLMAFFVGVSLWQQQRISYKKTQITSLRITVDKTKVNVNKDAILKRVAQYNNQGKRLRTLSERYLGLAVISELFALTPPRVRLVNLIADLSDVPDEEGKKEGKKVVVDGIVSGNSQTFEASLAEYMLRLTDSPIIETSRIEKSAIEYIGDKEVLRFVAHLVLIDRTKI